MSNENQASTHVFETRTLTVTPHKKLEEHSENLYFRERETGWGRGGREREEGERAKKKKRVGGEW